MKTKRIKINFPSQRAQGLGGQLDAIISAIMPFTSDCYWLIGGIEIVHYKAGVDPTSESVNLHTDGRTTRRIDDIATLRSLINKVDQFDWAVLAAVPNTVDITPESTELFGDEKELMQIPSAEVEIRVFDGSFFEVYSSNEELLDTLRSMDTNVEDEGGAIERVGPAEPFQ